jgi:two-component system, OmpR family, response regulator
MTYTLSTSLAAELASTDLPILRWPEQDSLRRQLAESEIPRLLVVAEGHPPPDRWDELEDWIREPVALDELDARKASIRARASRWRRRPRLDDDGLLWVGDAWVGVSPGQAPMVRLLVDRVGQVVRYEEMTEACESAGTSGHIAAIKAHLTRLERRLAPLGLRLRSVRSRGVLLEPCPEDERFPP